MNPALLNQLVFFFQFLTATTICTVSVLKECRYDGNFFYGNFIIFYKRSAIGDRDKDQHVQEYAVNN